MPKDLDWKVVNHRPARSYVLYDPPMDDRGLRDGRPKRLHDAKAVATLTRQTLARMPERRSCGLCVLASPLTGSLEPLYHYLGEFVSFSLASATLPVLLDQLEKIQSRTLFCVFGENTLPEDEDYRLFAEALIGHNRKRESLFLEKLAQRAETKLDLLRAENPVVANRRGLLIQEKPGKLDQLDLRTATLAHRVKQWKNLTDKESSSAAPATADGGFGYATLAVDVPGKSKPKGAATEGTQRRGLASFDFRLAASRYDLDSGQVVARRTARWLEEELGLSFRHIRRFVLGVPSPVICDRIAQDFVEVSRGALTRDVMSYPDLLLGWQPALSFLRFLARGELPALFVNTGRFPLIQAAAVWDESPKTG